MAKFLPPSPDISAKTPSATYYSSEMEKEDASQVKERNLSATAERKFISEEEELDISPTIAQKVAAEFMGTFILLFLGCGSGFIDQKHNITLVGVAFVWGLTVMVVIYTLGHISGAHINPAVTIAFAVTGWFPWKQVLFYVVAQVVGAILACVMLRWLFDGDRPQVMLTLPAINTRDLIAVAWEIMASFILMWVICGAASDHRATKELSGASIGAAIFLDAMIIGTITGASMNPARSVGAAIAAHNFHKLWIYIISPVIGTTAAASLYNLLRSPSELRKNSVKNVTSKLKSSLNRSYASGKETELP